MTINGWSLQIFIIFIICGYFTSFLSFCHATTICAANPLSNCVTIAYNVSTEIAQCKLFNGITVIVDGEIVTANGKPIDQFNDANVEIVRTKKRMGARSFNGAIAVILFFVKWFFKL